MLDNFLARTGLRAPFEFLRIARPDAGVETLFSRSFHSPPPDYPNHFVARHRASGAVAAYIHFLEEAPGIYLCGGLCVDSRLYRRCTAKERSEIARHGSLSRWLLNESINLLGAKLAVFAYTGNSASVRDGLSSGFVATPYPHLIVQWHAAAPEARPAMLETIARKGAF